MRHLGWVPVAALAIAAGASATPALAGGQSGTTLAATVTATAHQTKTYAWSLDKTVTRARWTCSRVTARMRSTR
jgi:hypothetical protein